MKKFVLRLDLQEDQDKRRDLKTVCTLSGIDEITIDIKGKTLTVIGTVDPVSVVIKLRKKNWEVGIISLGPAKETEKKEEEEKKDEPKKEEHKEEPKKEEEEPEKEEETKKEEEPVEDSKSESEKMVERLTLYKQYYPPMNPYIYESHTNEEDPNACVIC